MAKPQTSWTGSNSWVRAWRPLAALAPVVLAVAAIPQMQPGGTAWAFQFKVAKEDKGEDGFEADVLPYALHHESRQKLAAARKAIETEQYHDAVELLSDLLGEKSGEDYFLRTGDPKTPTTLRAEAWKLLGSLPPRGRDAYELQFGSDARSLLEKAVSQGSVALLAETSRRFFQTKAGNEATLLLGRYHLEQGEAHAGAICLTRLAESSSAKEYEPELSLLLAACWMEAGQSDAARSALVKAKAVGGKTIRLSGADRAWFDTPENALAWYRQAIGDSASNATRAVAHWTMPGGNTQRNAHTAAAAPLLDFHWRNFLVSRSDEAVVRSVRKQFQDQNTAVIPAIQAIATGEVVVVRGPSYLLGLDLEQGKRVWYSMMENGTERYGARIQNMDGSPSDAGQNRSREIQERLLEDAAAGQLSSDGEHVFYLERSASSSQPTNMQVRMRFGMFPGDAFSRRNSLRCLNIRKEGTLDWSLGDAGSHDPLLKGDVCFLGVPAPYNGAAYALAEVNGEIQLLAIEISGKKAGKVNWAQQVAQLREARGMGGDPNRRYAGCSPSIAEGIIVCPTSAGAIVAVDSVTHSLLWGFKYGKQAAEQGQFGWQGNPYANQPSNYGRRWLDSSVVISEGRVLVTPVEWNRLYCLDLLTGKEEWSKERDEMLFVGCVHKGQVVMVGKNRVTALRMRSGSDANQTAGSETWHVELKGLVAGRGIYTGKQYLIATSTGELVSIDLDEGKEVRRVQTPQPMGNLIGFKDQIISATMDSITSYYQADPLRKQVQKRLDAKPNDSWALARQAEILLYDGKPKEALDSLRQAWKVDKSDDEIRGKLVKTLLMCLREPYAGDESLAAELEPLIDLPEQRAEFTRLQADGLRKAGASRKAFEAYSRIAELAKGESPLERVDPNLMVRRDRWLQGRMALVLAEAKEPERARIDELFAGRLAAISGQPSSRGDALAAFIARSPPHRLVDEARLQLGVLRMEAGELPAARSVLSWAALSADPNVAAAASWQIARLLLKEHKESEARAVAEQVAARWPDVEVGGRKASELLTEFTSPTGARNLTAWPAGKVTLARTSNMAAARIASVAGAVVPLQIRDWNGPISLPLSAAMETNRGTLVFRDSLGNEISRIRILGRDVGRANNTMMHAWSLIHAKVSGHLLVVSLGYEIVAIDLTRRTGGGEATLWRRDVGPINPGPGGGEPQITPRPVRNPWLEQSRMVAADGSGRNVGVLGPVGPSGVVFQRSRELVCVDPETGDTLWSREGLPAGCELLGDEDVVLAIPPNETKARMFRMLDGSPLGEAEVPEEHFRWASVGRKILCFSQDGRGVQLRLEDPTLPAEKRVVWSRDFDRGVKGQLLQNDELAAVQPDGTLVILDLASGKPRLETKLQEEVEAIRAAKDKGADLALSGVIVLRSSEQYLVMVNRPYEEKPEVRHSTSGAGEQLHLSNGRLYAFSRSTGKPMWGSAAVIDRFGLPLDHPPDLPLLVLLRHTQPSQPTAEGRTPRAGLLVLDRRDGRFVAQTDLDEAVTGYAISGNPATSTINVSVGSRSYALKMTSDAIPPQPPAQGDNKPNPPQPPAPGGVKPPRVDELFK